MRNKEKYKSIFQLKGHNNKQRELSTQWITQIRALENQQCTRKKNTNIKTVPLINDKKCIAKIAFVHHPLKLCGHIV